MHNVLLLFFFFKSNVIELKTDKSKRQKTSFTSEFVFLNFFPTPLNPKNLRASFNLEETDDTSSLFYQLLTDCR